MGGGDGCCRGNTDLEVEGCSKSSQEAVDKLGFGGAANGLSADSEGLWLLPGGWSWGEQQGANGLVELQEEAQSLQVLKSSDDGGYDFRVSGKPLFNLACSLLPDPPRPPAI